MTLPDPSNIPAAHSRHSGQATTRTAHRTSIGRERRGLSGRPFLTHSLIRCSSRRWEGALTLLLLLFFFSVGGVYAWRIDYCFCQPRVRAQDGDGAGHSQPLIVAVRTQARHPVGPPAPSTHNANALCRCTLHLKRCPSHAHPQNLAALLTTGTTHPSHPSRAQKGAPADIAWICLCRASSSRIAALPLGWPAEFKVDGGAVWTGDADVASVAAVPVWFAFSFLFFIGLCYPGSCSARDGRSALTAVPIWLCCSRWRTGEQT
ncbi:hypothetical protein IWZ00DRAFT_166677 [Phyllosticta capitalensis]